VFDPATGVASKPPKCFAFSKKHVYDIYATNEAERDIAMPLYTDGYDITAMEIAPDCSLIGTCEANGMTVLTVTQANAFPEVRSAPSSSETDRPSF
jgi:hypothetical protein